MKKAIVLTAALMITGCTASESLNVKALRRNEYATIQESALIKAITDEETCVVYIYYDAPYKVAMTPRIGPDGKPALNQECVENKVQ